MQTFTDLLEQHAGLAVEKQRALSQLLGQHHWNVNIPEGKLSFTLQSGETIACDIQLIGTESFESQTWLWAWANKQSHLPLKLLRGVMELQEFGVVSAMEPLTRDTTELSEIPAQVFAIVAAGFTDADAYYRGDYGSGALYCALRLPELRERPATTNLEIIGVMTELISAVELNHRRTLLNYVKAKSWRVFNEERTITAQASDGSRVVAHFDELDRITSLQTQ
jgi:hypothetical protein